MIKRLVYGLLFLLLGCVEPYKLKVEDGPQLLTVEGILHTGPGPHLIRITRSSTYGGTNRGLIQPVLGAVVEITDNEEQKVSLEENLSSKGNYFTPQGFRAEVGKSYTLKIQTREGQTYTSQPERVESVPPIENLLIRTVTIPVEGKTNPRSGVQLISEFKDPADQKNYYFFRISPIIHILQARPDLYVIRETREPAPKPCCYVCYRTEAVENQGLFIAQDNDFNGLTARIPGAFIEDEGLRFVQRLRVDLKQYSISEEAYQFLRFVKQQTEIKGSIFDTPPATIRGNMSNINDPEEVVLGYFISAGESVKRIYINREDLTYRQNQGLVPDDCREIPGATVFPPADWLTE